MPDHDPERDRAAPREAVGKDRHSARSEVEAESPDATSSLPASLRSVRPVIWWATFLVTVGIVAVASAVGQGRFEIRLALSLLAVVWVLVRWVLNPRIRSEALALMIPLVALFGFAVKVEMYKKTVSLYGGSWFNNWTVYHYYMGSKYFAEVGYYDLYLQSIVADREDGDRALAVRRVCDQRTYRYVNVDEMLPSGPNPEFTDERWQAFKRDLRAFTDRAGPSMWPKMMRDRGYNPTPFWTFVGGFLSNRLSILEKPEYLLLISADLALYLLMFGLLWWAFGLERAILASLVIILTPVTVGRMVGGFLRHDWLAAIFIAVALIRRHRPVGAGIAFGYAAMTRAFPLLLLVGLAVSMMRRSLESRRIDTFDRRFVISLLVFCAFAVGAGCLTGRGCSAWGDWIDKMRVHNREAPFWNRSTGLKHFFVHDLGDFSNASFETDPTSRKNILDSQKSWYLGTAALYLALLAISFRNSQSDVNTVLLSSVVVFVLAVSSHYYWAIFGLLPLWIDDARDSRRVVSRVATLAALLVPASAYWFFLHHDIKFQRGVFVDLLLGVALLAVMAIHIWRSRAAARAC